MEADQMAGGVGAFGDLLRGLIMEKGLSLRELARRSGMDASNLSKIERGVAYPPQKRENLEKLAKALGLKGPAKEEFFQLAAHVNGIIPEEMKHVRSNGAIPLLMRTIDKRELSEEQVRALAEMIQKDSAWQGRVIE
jgi:transcriptional regulator with XRE-family HTH domain